MRLFKVAVAKASSSKLAKNMGIKEANVAPSVPSAHTWIQKRCLSLPVVQKAASAVVLKSSTLLVSKSFNATPDGNFKAVKGKSCRN
eukprot:4649814-Amphidinium_carterae.3